MKTAKRKPKQQAKKGSRKPGGDWLVPVGLFAMAALVYLPALNGQFVWDDEIAIQKNSFYRSLGGLWQIWTDLGNIPGEEHYWPLTHSVLWLEWNFWAGNPTGFHAVNFFLHGLIVVQIWRLARRIGIPGAAVGAALFAVHPIHTEAVAWIISVKDLLATLLSLACIEFYLNARQPGGWRWLTWACIAAAAAMLCKSSPVTLAATIAILAWYRQGRIEKLDWRWIGALAAITISIGLADWWVVKHNPYAKPLPAPDLIDRIMQSGWTFWFYAGKLIWPVELGPVYPMFRLNVAHPLNWLPLVMAVVVAIALWLARRKIGRAPLACWLFYGLSLSPVIGVIYFGFLRFSPAADRYQYWPSIAPLLLAGAALGRLIEKSASAWKFRWRCAAAALVIAAAILSWRHAYFFVDSDTYLQRALVTSPNSAFVKQIIGTQYLGHQNYRKAEALYREALQIQPDYWDAACNLGMALIRDGRERDAAQVYRQAVEQGCNGSELLSNYAWLLATADDASVRDPKKAVELAQRSLQDPLAVAAQYHQNLALALEADGRFAEALDVARKARAIAEQQKAYETMRELDRSISRYERAVQPEPE